MSDWKNRLINLEKSYEVLCHHAVLFSDNKSNVEFYQIMRAGLIHVYEHTLELSWKTLKDYLVAQGFNECNTPKQVIRTSFTNGIIKDGDLWIEAIDDRNMVAHEYDEHKADILCSEIIDKYTSLIGELCLYLQQELVK
jgi:nucleotidyltransferase substrate binding protein (TIGR01987 family)